MKSNEVNEILDFIDKTREGSFTEVKPEVAQVTYSRMVIPGLEDAPKGEVILYGLSY